MVKEGWINVAWSIAEHAHSAELSAWVPQVVGLVVIVAVLNSAIQTALKAVVAIAILAAIVHWTGIQLDVLS